MKKARIKAYPTNIELFTDSATYHIDIDFQDSSHFADNEEAYEWIDETLCELQLDIENLEQIREDIRSAIDRYVA